MGAAVGKAVEDSADAAKTGAEVRLAAAEYAILQRDRSPGSDTTSIWDSDAACTNRSLLAAVDELVRLKEIHAFPMASPARRRMDSALGVAMSRLMQEFLVLRVWDASQLQDVTSLRFAAEKLSSSMAPSGGASLAFPTTTGSTTGELSLTSSDELYASGGSRYSSRTDGKFLDELDLICPASLSVLHEIALRVIRAGYTEELLRAFPKAPCDVLDMFLSILQVDCSLEADPISFEDAEWWTTEDMIKRWILATKLGEKALLAMRRQLEAQGCGAFDRFKNDYFLAIAKRGVFSLLRFADGFTCTQSPDKLIYVLDVYEALSNASPGLLLLFTSHHRELISRQVIVVLSKLARASRTAVGGLVTEIRADRSLAECATRGVGVHPLTWYAMRCVDLLAPHRTVLDLILAEGGKDKCRGGAEAGRVCSFGTLVSELVYGLERNLEEESAVFRAEGSRHLFLANNVGFVLKRAADADVVTALLGDEWAACRRGRLEQHLASYLDASWGPVVACLETAVGGSKPRAKVVTKFNAALKKAYGSEVCREVPDPELRAALRKAVTEMVVPAYSSFLQMHPKIGKACRCTADDLAELLLELFEGEAIDGRKS